MGDVFGVWLLGCGAHELTLFAATGLVLGGIDDLVIDLIWIVRTCWRRVAIYSRYSPVSARTLAPPRRPGRIAIFIGAWDEGAVIGAMLSTALDRFQHDDYRLFVGVYPNDPATIAAATAVRNSHPLGHRVRIVNGARNGPTTKAEALNRLWAELRREEAEEGVRFKAVVLHDAEDVVHPAELRLFDTLIERFDLVQIPVLPLPDPRSPWVSGHYIDEFSEAHGKQLVVREMLGAGMPSAGVGCAIARDALERLALARGGPPFDPGSITEDYELGLRLSDVGGRGIFVRLPADEGGPLVAVHAYFPATLSAAVRQKTRWMTGIALAGWDRLGWQGGIAERWMRLRDRRAILAHIVLLAAYAAMVANALLFVVSRIEGRGVPAPTPALAALLKITSVMLLWRLALRALMVTRLYGWREGLRSVPRTIVGNIIGMAAARRAVMAYARTFRQGIISWDKTEHRFPADLSAS